jgi:putative transposase
VLEIGEIKSVPYAPISHPVVERLICTIRREVFDQIFFWNALDLTRKLDAFSCYYNKQRVHRSLNGSTPAQRAGATAPTPAKLDHFGWRQYCHGLFQIPAAV